MVYVSSYQMNPAIVSSVSKTLAEMTVFPNWSDVANLAYWVTGTEGSNPSLPTIQSVQAKTEDDVRQSEGIFLCDTLQSVRS